LGQRACPRIRKTATWRQFQSGGNALRYCLVGTLPVLTSALSMAQVDVDLVGCYGAGLKVLKKWKSYSCFA
jgi:hypothetical protein